VTYIDANGCESQEGSGEITITPLPPEPVITSTGPVCEGECVTLSTKVQYEGSDINYVWFTPNGTMVNITGENSSMLEICPAIASEHDGDYSVGVTVDGCSIFSDSYYLDIFESPVVDPEVVYDLNPDCSFSNISLAANATGGTGPYTYDWTGPNGFVSTLDIATVANAGAASNGTYTVVVTDFNGCTTEGAVEVIIAENPQALPIIASSGPACEGECIILSVPVYEGSSVDYVWFTPNGTPVNITGENTNEISICPVEAAAHEGIYTVGVTVDGCSLLSDEYTLDVFEQPIVEVEADLACIGSDITLTTTVTNAADLSGPLTYEWTGPNGFTSDAASPTIANATAADAGTYTVTVSTLTGCATTFSIDIDVYDAPPAAQIEGPSIVCAGEPFTLCTSTAGDYPDAIFTYSPPNSSSTASQITAVDGCITVSSESPAYVSGAWTVTYTDGEGCASEPGIPHEVLIQAAPTATADNNGPICFGEDVQLFAGIVDGATYAWYVSGASEPFTTQQNPVVTDVIANTTYVVEVTVNGCTSTAETEVILEGPIVEVSENTPVCTGATVVLTATVTNAADFNGLITYEWTGPNGFFSNAQNPTIANAQLLDAGTYTVVVTTTGECQGVASVEVEVYNVLPAATIDGPAVVCEGNPFTLCTSSFADYPGGSFSFSPPNSSSVSSAIPAGANGCITVTPEDPAYVGGDWTVSYTDAEGCSSAEGIPFELLIQDLPIATAENNGPICFGEDVELTSGYVEGAVYAWYVSGDAAPFSTDQNTTVTNVTENTTYTVAVSVNGCVSTADTYVILEGPVVTATENTPICVGGDIELTATVDNEGDFNGFITYEWSGPNGYTSTAQNPVIPNATLADAGTYTVLVTTSGTCKGQSTVEVEVYNTLPAATIEGEEYVCEGESFTLCTSSFFDYPGGTFLFSPPNSSSVSSAIAADANGCITVNPLSSAYVSGDWTVEYTDANGCASEQGVPFTVTIQPLPVATADNDGPICYGDNVALTAGYVEGATYEWYAEGNPIPFSTDQNTTVTDLTAKTTYEVHLTVNGCTSIALTTVILEGPIVEATDNTPVCTGEDIVLTAEILNAGDFTGFVSYEWTGPNGYTSTAQNPVIANATLADAGTYTVIATTSGTCQGQATTEVEVYEVLPAATIEGPEYVCLAGDLLAAESFTLCTSSYFDHPGGTFLFSPPNSSSVSSAIPADANGCITVTPDDPAYVSGDWTVTYANANGCESEQGIPFTVTLQERPQATAQNSGPICYGDDVQLFAGPVDGATYAWYSENNPFTPFSTEQNPVITYLTEETTFVVDVTVNGCTSSNFTTVVLEGPEVIATENTPVCTGEDIVLTAEIANIEDFTGFISYEWTGPNGFTSDAQNPVIANASLADAGTYTVLVNTTGECQGTATVEVEVYDVLPAAAIDGPDIVCEGESFTLCTSSFEDYPGGSFTISPPNSTSVSSALAVDAEGCVTINAGDEAYISGAFTVLYTNANGCESEEGVPFVVSINPIPESTAWNSGPICYGEPVQLFAGDVPGATYEWYNEDNVLISTNQNPIVYDLEEETTFGVYVTLNGCTSALNFTTVMFDGPQVTVFATTPVCIGSDIQLTGLVLNEEEFNGVITYSWTGPNGFTSNAQNPFIANATLADAGTYTLTVNTTSDCIGEASVDVDVYNALPPAGLDGPEIVCEGESFTLCTSNYHDYGGATFTVSPPNSTSISSAIEVDEEGCVTINPGDFAYVSGAFTVVYTDASGCAAEPGVPFVVNINPIPEATAWNSGPICFGEPVQLFAGDVPGATYEWYTGDDLVSTDQNPYVFDLSAETTYTVYTTLNGCTSEGASTTVTFDGPQVTVFAPTPVCIGSDIPLTGNVLNAGSFNGELTYSWTGPNGFTSNAQNPVVSNVTLAASGTYTLVVTTTSGCPGTASVDVDVYEALPSASIDGPEIVCEGEPFTLCTSNYHDYADATFTISPPNSTSTSSALEVDENGCVTINPGDFAYVSGGFTVSYTSADGCIAEEGIAHEVSINAIPVVSADNNGAICAGDDVQLIAGDLVGASYEWYSGGVLVSTEQNPVIYGLDVTTTYEVIATVGGCASGAAITTVTVHPLPAIVSILGGDTYCEGTDVTLASIVQNAGPGSVYTWIGPNGFEYSALVGGNLTLPNVTEADAGVYTLTVTSAEGCVSEPYSVTVDVVGQTQPEIVSSDSGCEGGEITMSITAYEGLDVIYTWTTPNGETENISGLNTHEIMIDPASADLHNGEYTVSVTVNGCVLTSLPYNLDINESPEAAPEATYNLNADCSFSNITLEANASGGTAPYTYEWTGPNGFTSTLANPGIANATTDNNGTYTVTVTDANGCSVAVGEEVLDIADPVDQPVITASDTGCEGDEVVLSVTTYGGSDVNYVWTLPSMDNVSGANTSTITIDPSSADLHNGAYSVAVTVDGCVLVSDVYDLVINPSPEVISILGGDVYCEGNDVTLTATIEGATAGSTYEWTGPNGLSHSGTVGTTTVPLDIPAITPEDAGTYTLTISNENGCSSAPYSTTIDVVPQTAPVIVSNDSGCEGGAITLSVPAYEGVSVTYSWTTPNGTTVDISGLNTHEIMIDPATAALHNGDYTVTITVDGCSLTSAAYNLDINESPEATPEATYNLNADCSFSNITLEANASSGTAPYTYEWTGPNGFTSTLANPGIANATTDNNGTYTVVVTDANGCSVTAGVEVLDIADPVDQPVITASETGCEGDEVILSVTTYSGSDVDYVWTVPSDVNVSGINTSTLTIDPSSAALHNGEYIVEVTVDGCVLTSGAYNLVINPSPEVISILGGDVYCEGRDVTLTAIVEGATPGSTYEWTGPNGLSHSGALGTAGTIPLAIAAITPEDAGTYTLVVTNENGCSSAPYSTTIDVIPQTAPVIVSSDSGCEGGQITLSVPSYEGVSVTYSWTTPNGTTVDISGLNTHEIMIDPATVALHNGDYTVTITVDGCSLTSAAYNLDINESPEANASASYVLNEDCSYADIELNTMVTGGTAPYTYDWTGPNGFTSTLPNPGIANATTESNGTYTVIITDANGCSTEAAVEVLNIEDPVAQPVITGAGAGCEGGDVTLKVTAYEGSSVEYAWTTPGGTTQDISGLNTNELTISPANAAAHNGIYSVTVTVDGCVLSSAPYNLDINASPIVIALAGGGVYCEGSDITLASIVSGADTGSTYEWNGPEGFSASGVTVAGESPSVTIPSVHAGQSGTYTLTVSNAEGCSTTATAIIKVIAQEQPVITSTDSGCEGGEVTLSVPAIEDESVTYTWTTPNGTTQDISGLSSNAITIDPTDAGVHNGTYTVTVSVNGCELSANYELDINDSPSAAPTANYSLNADCSFSNVTLEANASNGTAPYTYEWTGPNGFTSSLANPGIANATTDNNGTYTVTVTDANGCSFTTGVEVLNIEDPEAQPVISASGIGCEGDIVVLSVGIYEGSSVTYTWTTPGGTTVDMSGMNTNELTINPVSSTIHGGTYSVTVNIDGCELVSAPFNLDVNPAPIVIPEASYSLNADCSGADLLLTANATGIPPLTYDWSGPNGFTSDAENPVIVNATSAANGVYTVIVTDASGCSTEASTNVIDNISDTVAEPVITASENTCEGGEVILSIASYEGSSVTYTWSTPNSVTVGISGLNTPSISISPVSAALHSGEYSVTIEIDGCTLTSDPYNLEINAAPIVSPEASYSLNADCASADLLLTANATGVQPLTYDWTGPNGFTSNAENPVIVNATAADNGVYTVIVTDAEGCSTEASTNVITDIQDPISEPVIAATDTGCEGGEVTLSITAYEGSSVSYTWSTPSETTVNISGLNTNAITIDPADAAIHNGPYTVTVNVDGCELTSDVFNLDINPAPAPTDLTGGGTYCEGDDVLLSAANLTAGMEYTWSGPNGFTYSGITTDATMPTVFLPSVDESDAGVYTLSLVSAQGCISAPASLIVEVVGQPDTPELVANDVELCEGDILELSVTAPVSGTDVTYEWYYNAGAMGEPFAVTTTPNVLVTDAATVADGGAYTVVVVSGETGCASAPSNFIMVEVEAIPDVPSSVIDLTICEGESIPAGTGISAVCSDEQTTVERVSLVSDVDVPIGFGDSEAYGDGSMPYPGPNYAPPVVPSIPAGAVITNVTLDIVLTTFGNSCESDIVLEVIDPTGVATEFRPFTTCNGTAANNYTATINYAPNTVINASTVGSWTVNLKDTDDQNVGADEFWARYGALTYEYELSGSASGNLTWWDAEIGGDMLGQGSVYTPDTENMSAGVHTFWAQCGDACPSDRVPVTVTVVAAPPAPAIEHNSPVCLGETVTLCISTGLNDIPGATSIDYTFIPPSGSTSEQSTMTNGDGCIEVTEAGEWTAYYTVTYGDGMTCSSEVSAPVDISFTALEEPVITSSGPSCEGGTIVLTIPTYSGNMTGYAWFYDGSTPAGNLSNVTGENSNQLVISPVDASTHEGGYSVAVTVDGCTVQSDVYNLDVYDAANLAPSYELENNCEGGDLYLFANAEGAGSGAAYSWTGPNGFTSNAENPVLANADVNSNGTYTVTVTTASGCSATASVNVVVITDAPARPSIAVASAEVCEGENIVLSVPQSYPAGTVYTWIDGTGATIDSGTSSTITVASSTAQPFSVYVTVGDCISEVSDLAYVTVHETPIASATNNGPLCIGDDAQLLGGPIPAGGTYSWTDENGNLVSTAQNPVIYNIQSTSTYELVVTVNGCSSAVATTTVEVETVGEPLNPVDYVICEGDNIPQGQGLFAECFSGDLVTTFDTIQLVSDEDIFIGTMDTESYADNPPLIFADPGVPVGTQITGVQLRLFFRIEGASCESDIDIRVTDPLGNITEFISPITGCVGNSGGLYNFTTMLSPTGLAGLNSGNWIVELKDSNDQNAIAAGSPGNSAPAGTEYSVRFGDIQYMTELATGTSTNISWWDASVGGNMLGIDAPLSPANAEDYAPGVYTFWAECGFNCVSETRVPVRLVVNAAPDTPNLVVDASCAGGSLVLRTDVVCDSYQWIGPDGNGPITSVFEATIGANSSFYDEGMWYVVCEDVQGCTSESEPVEVNFEELSAPVVTNTTAGGQVCEGDAVQFFTQTPGSAYTTGGAISYTWFFNGTPWLVNGNPVTTQNPVIPAASMSNNGVYTVVASIGGCNSSPSAPTVVNVTPMPAQPVATASTPICEGEPLQLSTTFIPGATYTWFGPAGFTSNLANPIIPVATLSNAGEYYVYVTLNGCSSELSGAVVVVVNSIPAAPMAINDGPTCEGGDVNLMVGDPVPGVTYTWYSATTNTVVGVGATVTLPNVGMGDSGMYYVMADVVGCTSAFAETLLTVDESQTGNQADAGLDMAVCGDVASISATVPSNGAGMWTSPTGATIANPDAGTTTVSDLIVGENVFIWTLNNGACGGIDSDEMIIVVADEVIATDDVTAIDRGDQLMSYDVLDNDDIGGLYGADYTITVMEELTGGDGMGSLTNNGDGTFNYIPTPGFYGTVEFTYMVCSTVCEDVCSEARVVIDVMAPLACEIPNVFTPNGDGMNDNFEIPCLGNNEYATNKLVVFNRWGDQVYEQRGYTNSWSGTYNGKDLPEGTYYYVLKLNDTLEPLQGFIMIQR